MQNHDHGAQLTQCVLSQHDELLELRNAGLAALAQERQDHLLGLLGCLVGGAPWRQGVRFTHRALLTHLTHLTRLTRLTRLTHLIRLIRLRPPA